jgi:hypothetical protein
VSVARYGYHEMPTTIDVLFNEALDSAVAEDAKDYQIIGPAGRVIRIKSAQYDAADDSVTLHPAQRINIHHRYTLVFMGKNTGGLANTSGELLGSTGNGEPGHDVRVPLTWRNLVLGPKAAKKYDAKKTKARKSAEDRREPVVRARTEQTALFRRAAMFRRPSYR